MDWPRRRAHPPHDTRRPRTHDDIVRRLPVSASGPKTLPLPTLTPRSRRDAGAAAVVLAATLLMLPSLLVFSVGHLQTLNLLGKVVVGATAGLTSIAVLLFGAALVVYVLPVLFRVRRPAPAPPPEWDAGAGR